MNELRIGIIGGGLMGRETASALARWIALDGLPVRASLVGVCDLNPQAREWFRQVPTVKILTDDSRELLASTEIDAVYVAVPHNLHQKIYGEVLQSGKDLLAEKPFGIDLNAARAIASEAEGSNRFVRCSSEFPFLPGVQRVLELLRGDDDFSLGTPLEVRSGFWHSSDLDPTKPANWKRQVATCGEAGVMADLGMHAVHLPFRLGWNPKRVYAQLQKVYAQRPDGKGGMAVCDTWDNATLHCDVDISGVETPMRIETKRLAPGATNTWFFEVLGTDGGLKFSTAEPKTVWIFKRGQSGKKEQVWQRLEVGHKSVFPTVTGGIFEAGFPDCFLQMWGAFAVERAGLLGDKFGCVTPQEAVRSHELWNAALQSHEEKRAIELN